MHTCIYRVQKAARERVDGADTWEMGTSWCIKTRGASGANTAKRNPQLWALKDQDCLFLNP